MENKSFKLPRFKGVSQSSQLVGLFFDLSTYVSHLHFLKLSPEFFECMVVLQELGVSDLKHFVYLLASDFRIASTLNSLSVNLFDES